MFCDTDNLFITGLDHASVLEIIERFAELNLYHPDHIPGSILEIEKVNYGLNTGEPRTPRAHSIASERYAIFTQEPDGTYRLARERNAQEESVAKRSEYGLGHFVPPKPGWEDDLWKWIVNTGLRSGRNLFGQLDEG